LLRRTVHCVQSNFRTFSKCAVPVSVVRKACVQLQHTLLVPHAAPPGGDASLDFVLSLQIKGTEKEEGSIVDRERPSTSDSKGKIPEAWIGQEVMLETTEALSSDLRAAAPVYLEDVNDRGIVMLVTRHKDQSQFSRYFYPWSVVGWIRLAEEDERTEPRAGGF
jgi:hypothetical protein